MGYIYVLEFGGQHTDLICNRLEEMGFDVAYADSDTKISDMRDAAGIILSGGPKSVTDPDSFRYDPEIFSSGINVLGICYGMQLLGKHLGSYIHRKTREYGETLLRIIEEDQLFYGLPKEEIVWMNHGDSITPDGNFTVLGYTEKGVPAAIRSSDGKYRGVQFHPEVTHTEHGTKVLRNFAELVCGCSPQERQRDGFDAGRFIDEAIRELKKNVGNKIALVYASGGVDSSVAAYLAMMAGLKIKPVYLEMGNGRKGEAQQVSEYLGRLLKTDIYIHDASANFIDRLCGIDDPEQKRKKFQELYAETRKEIEKGVGLKDVVLIQGTIATDLRETGREAGKNKSRDTKTVDRIKTHHNVGAENIWKGQTVLPLADLTKDRVRLVARELGIPNEIAERQPFPGPGLYVRFVTGYYEPEPSLSAHVSDIARQYNLGCFVLPRKGVGLKGDERAFEHAVLLAGERDWGNVRGAAKQMIEDLDISRVLYLPETCLPRINVKNNYHLERENLDRLRDVTDVVETEMKHYGVASSQTPVITFGGRGAWISVIRDVNSQDFRTLRPLKKPEEFSWECYEDIVKKLGTALGRDSGITVFDVSDKPGGTTEWE